MLDLPKLLDCELIERIYPFLERDHEEFTQIVEDQEKIHTEPNRINSAFCNFEDFITHPSLPPFSKDRVSYHVMQNFIDYHNVQQELLFEVIQNDSYMTWEVENFEEQSEDMRKKCYEVEHSLIDF